MPAIVGTLAIVLATTEMAAAVEMPAREGPPTKAGTLAKHQQQHGLQKQVRWKTIDASKSRDAIYRRDASNGRSTGTAARTTVRVGE
jgi:hypothetical protein